ncbi:hypothetical protein ACUC97_28790, partial [Escherichia coli]
MKALVRVNYPVCGDGMAQAYIITPSKVRTHSFSLCRNAGAVSYQTSAMKFSNAFQKFKGLKLYLYLTVPARKVTFLNRNRL